MIHLEGEIIGSRLDEKTGCVAYTLEKNRRRWTVEIPVSAFEGKNKAQCRQHLTDALLQATFGPDDEQRAAQRAAATV